MLMRRDTLLALLTVCLATGGVFAFDDVVPTDPEPSVVTEVSPPVSAPADTAVRQSDRNSRRRSPASARIDAAIEARLRRMEEAIHRLESQVEGLLKESGRTPGSLAGSSRRGEPGFRGLYMINRDGTDPQFCVAAPGMIATSDPAWSNDGRYVAMNGFPHIDAFSESKLFVYTLEGPDTGTFRDLGYGSTPSWSPDDRQIAFTLLPGNPGGHESGLWLMDADGSNRRRIGDVTWPRWSPDGKRLSCHGSRSDGGQSLVLVDPVSLESRALFESSEWSLVGFGSSWSSDGQRIAFVGEFDGKTHVATIDVDGSPNSIRILYTNENRSQYLFGPPSWSRDGRQLLFSIQDAGVTGPGWSGSNLYSMAPDVPCAPVLLERKRVGNINRMATWSPDSSKIIFSSER